jgi:hypothetical protein
MKFMKDIKLKNSIRGIIIIGLLVKGLENWIIRTIIDLRIIIAKD